MADDIYGGNTNSGNESDSTGTTPDTGAVVHERASAAPDARTAVQHWEVSLASPADTDAFVEPDAGEAPMPRQWERDLYRRCLGRDRPPQQVDVPARLHPAARDFADDIGPVLEVLNAGTEDDSVTSRVSQEQLPAALFHAERLRTTVGALTERAFMEVAGEDWGWLAVQLDMGRAEVGDFAQHLSEQYRTRNDGFDPDALVPADRESFTVAVTPEGWNAPYTRNVAARVPALFGALCDRDVPHFVSGDTKIVLLAQSVHFMDAVERITNRLIATAEKRGMPAQEIAEYSGVAQPEIESRMRTAEIYARRISWLPHNVY